MVLMIQSVLGTRSQRVQVLNIGGLWSQIPLRVCVLEPESLNIGYLDPLGYPSLASELAAFRGITPESLEVQACGPKGQGFLWCLGLACGLFATCRLMPYSSV